MRVFLKAKKGGQYYCGATRTVATPGEALEFESVTEATRFALTEQLADAEIALRWDYGNAEIRMPVLPDQCKREEPREMSRV